MSSRRQKERRKAARQAAESLVINGQEFVDRRDYLPTGFGFGGGMFGIGLNLQTSLNDRKDGRNAPFVENEYDAATIRGFARFITTINCPGIGIVENLKNYIIGRGIKSSVTAKKGRQVPDGLVECCQDVIDEFNEDNKIIGNFDRESLLRDRRDGECYIGLYPKKGKTHLRTIEPDSVKDPGAAPFTEEFLNEHFGLQIEYATRWTWGHHTDEHDIENCHGLCIQWATAEPYDYLPRKYWHQSKAENVDRCVLRGMSDFYPAWKWLKQQERLLTNTGEGAAELAAISYITQFVNATQEQVRSMRASQADYEITRMGASGGSNTIYKHKREPGVLNVPSGQEYLPGPMGAERGQSFLQVVQGILRQVGTRWCMTEGMISGDDSNNNMASSVEAGGRFWKYADASQGRECAKWQEIHTRVLQNAFDMGRFERFGITWEEMRRSLIVTVNCPEIDVRDPKILADTRAIEMDMGILSPKTAAEEAGYDYEKEVAQGAKKGDGGMGGPGGGFPGQGGPGGPGGGPDGLPGAPLAPQQRQPGEWEDKSRMQWKRNVKAISDVVQALQAKTISAIQAKVQLGMLGMNPDRIDSLLEDVEDDGQMNNPQNVQDLAESFAWHCSRRWRMIREASPPFSTVAESGGGGNPNHDPSNGQFASGGGSSGGEFTSGPGGSSGPAPKATKGRAARTATRKAVVAAASSIGGDHTETPEFKRWFAGSKMVDEDGKPLVFSHSTDADFSQFDMKFFTSKGDIKGFYFSPGKEAHVTMGEKKNNLIVHLNLKNPASMDDVMRLAKTGIRAPQLAAALKKEGFDGVYNPKDKMVIAFDPRQIKSATKNAGTFNPKSKSIYESTAILGTGLDPFIDYP